MASVTFKVEGLEELAAAMRKLSKDTNEKFAQRATGAAAGGVVKPAAKQKLRSDGSIRTGAVEANVIAKHLPQSQTELTSEHIVTIKKKIYARNARQPVTTRRAASILEHGSVKQTPKPFLRPALQSNIQRCIDAMQKSLVKDIFGK